MKLFGTTILFISDDLGMEKDQSLCLSSSSVSYQYVKKPVESQFTKESDSSTPIEDPTPSTENPQTPSFETEPDLQNYSKNEQSETNSENTPTKPQKILPCPRCDSTDTKFCYYNNYNLTQPRYFCKKCQRYWTSGGTMRNVPVGSGRRRNKNAFDSHNCPMMVPESFLCSQAYGKVLDFGSNPRTKPCESFVPKPKFCQNSQNSLRNEFLFPVRKEFSSRENRDDMSSITSSGSVDNKGNNDSVIQESVNIPNFQNFSSIMFYQSPGIWSFPCFYQNHDSKNPGKRTREMETFSGLEENNLWCPKALRFDDPSEGADRSIWSSLRMKNEKSGIKGKVILGSKENGERYVGDNSLVLQANPAALTRSLNFHEII